jgi:hypothetical protein
MKNYLKSALFFLLAFTVATFVSCGGSSKDESGALNPPAADLTGEWSVTENGTDCEGSYSDMYNIETSQSGNNITFTIDSHSVNGTISGNIVKWNWSFPKDGGTVTISFSGTVSSDGNTVTGRSSWRWTNASTSCSGTATLSATRISVPVPPETPAINLTGQWLISENGTDCEGTYTDSYAANISQSGNNLIITIGSTVINGTISENTITWHYFFSEGNETTTSDFSGSISSDGNSFTGQLSCGWTDSVDSCSGIADLSAARQ